MSIPFVVFLPLLIKINVWNRPSPPSLQLNAADQTTGDKAVVFSHSHNRVHLSFQDYYFVKVFS